MKLRFTYRLLGFVAIANAVVFFLSSCVTISEPYEIKFNNHACLVPTHRYDYTLCSDLRFKVDSTEYTVPKGFVTDLASVPKLLYWKYPPHYVPFTTPAIIHDYLYYHCGLVDRKKADDILYYALLAKGVKKNTAYKFWLGVRLCGWVFFNNECDTQSTKTPT